MVSGRIIPYNLHDASYRRIIWNILFKGIDTHDGNRAFETIEVKPISRSGMYLCSCIDAAMEPIPCTHIGTISAAIIDCLNGKNIGPVS